ncbi:abasic site processing protein HMCES-like [Apostichopus japonicus]|uniref:abasic site processing protein HMCES-like n=1 Tax=Stichopus japonicus TaxID=307972 RepID=UPI003AB55095
MKLCSDLQFACWRTSCMHKLVTECCPTREVLHCSQKNRLVATAAEKHLIFIFLVRLHTGRRQQSFVVNVILFFVCLLSIIYWIEKVGVTSNSHTIMCGRTACTLDPNQLRQACTYTNRQGQSRQPRWRRHGNDGGGGGHQSTTKQTGNHDNKRKRKYFPSYNTAPQALTPVLVSSQHLKDEDEESNEEQSLMLMKWGLVPSWHKGDPSAIAYKMNNCRSEGMMEKASFKRPFEKGQRCVVLADGYYEWHTDSNKKKQPYFIYFSQQEPVKDLNLPESYEFDYEGANGEIDEKWTGHRLLTMAGIFDKWTPPDGSDPLYSYSVITIEADPSVSWIHHRMPVMLDGEEAVRDWLDFGNVSASKALTMMKPLDCLLCHPVTPQMGNIRYKDPDCIKEISLQEKKKPNTFMTSWLKTSSKSEVDVAGQPLVDVKVKSEKKTGLTAWLQKANKPETVKRAVESASPEKKIPAKVCKLEKEVKTERSQNS